MDENVLNENLKNYFVGKIKSLENELDKYKEEAQNSRKVNQGMKTFGGRSFPEVKNEPFDAEVIARVIKLAMVPINDDNNEVNYIVKDTRIFFVSYIL